MQNNHIQGIYAIKRARARARRIAIIRPILITIIVLFFVLGAMHADHNFIMAS